MDTRRRDRCIALIVCFQVDRILTVHLTSIRNEFCIRVNRTLANRYFTSACWFGSLLAVRVFFIVGERKMRYLDNRDWVAKIVGD